MMIAVCLAWTLCMAAPAAGAGTAGQPAALVESIRPPASVRTAAGKVSPLHPRLDVARVLLSGQTVTCGKGGEVVLRVGDRKVVVTAGHPLLLRVTGASSEGSMLAAIKQFYRRGGRDRGSEGALYSPSSGSAVRPSSFAFRWQPVRVAVRLEVRDPNGKVVWQQSDIDGALGELTSGTAQEALTRHRNNGGADPLTASLLDGNGKRSQQEFHLLAAGAEAELDRELTRWSREPEGSPLRYVGRADAFSRRLLLAEVVQEYEAGLKALPHSRAMLQAAAQAHRETGNFARAAELLSRADALGR